jgi:predicted ester cyclase
MADVRTTFHTVFDLISRGELDRLGEVVHRDVVDHRLIPGQGDGLPGLTYWARTIRTVMPDLTAVVQDTVVEGDKVAGRVLFSGTLDASRLPAAPTDPWVESEVIVIMDVRDGLVVEWWDASDPLEVLRNLGVRLSLEP